VDNTDLMELLTREEPLHEDLLPYFEEDGPIGPSLRSPLVYDVIGVRPAYANWRYAQKKAALEDALANGKWHTAVFIHERPYRVDALLRIVTEHGDAIDDATYWSLVGSVWVDSENVWQNRAEWDVVFHGLREHDEAHHMMDDDERATLAQLPDRIKVYRGAVDQVNDDGLSWTLDEAKAQWFARRFDRGLGTAVVVHGWVAKEDVLAYFSGRGESEIVVVDAAAVQFGKVVKA
jgi:hypothetical protein